MTPNVRDDSMVRVSQENFEVRVDERAVGGRANRRLLEILAEHFKVPKSSITILKGTKTRNKTIQVILDRTPRHVVAWLTNLVKVDHTSNRSFRT